MSGDAHDIFMSYRRGDREIVASLARRLEARGVTCWYDAGIGAPTGAEETRQALARSRLLVIFFSEETRRSRDLAGQAALADAARKPVVVIQLDGTEPRGTALWMLADRHWVKAHPEPSAHLDALADLLATLSGKGPAAEAAADDKAETPLQERERRLDDAISSMIHDAIDPRAAAPTDPRAYVGRVGHPGRTIAPPGIGTAVANLLTLGVYGARRRARAIRSFRSNIRKL